MNEKIREKEVTSLKQSTQRKRNKYLSRFTNMWWLEQYKESVIRNSMTIMLQHSHWLLKHSPSFLLGKFMAHQHPPLVTSARAPYSAPPLCIGARNSGHLKSWISAFQRHQDFESGTIFDHGYERWSWGDLKTKFWTLHFFFRLDPQKITNRRLGYLGGTRLKPLFIQ
jgi:hypothetical protein